VSSFLQSAMWLPVSAFWPRQQLHTTRRTLNFRNSQLHYGNQASIDADNSHTQLIASRTGVLPDIGIPARVFASSSRSFTGQQYAPAGQAFVRVWSGWQDEDMAARRENAQVRHTSYPAGIFVPRPVDDTKRTGPGARKSAGAGRFPEVPAGRSRSKRPGCLPLQRSGCFLFPDLLSCSL